MTGGVPVRVTDEIGEFVVNAIPYPAGMRRDAVTVPVPEVEDDLVGPAWGAAYADIDPGEFGWWC